jgi:hypothetical protein
MKLLNKMIWVDHSYIRDGFFLWFIPNAIVNEKKAKESVESFTISLNEKIKGL